MTTTIRVAVPEDLPELQRIYRLASLSNEGDRDALLSHPEHLVFAGSGLAAGRTRVAVIGRELAGFASTIAIDSDRLELEDLFVDPGRQRHGIGRRLVADLALTARGNGVRTIWVTGNPHARAFYLAVGFLEADRVSTELGPAFRYRLELSASPGTGAVADDSHR